MPVALKTERFGYEYTQIVDEEQFKKTSSSCLGPISIGSANVVMDLTGEVQGGFSITDLLQQQFGSAALNVLGFTSCFSIFTGAQAIIKGYDQVKFSQKIHNLNLEILGWLKCLQGAIQTAAGTLFVPAAVLTLTLMYVASKTATIFANVFGQVGSGLLGLGSLVGLITSAMGLFQKVDLRLQINASLEDSLPEEERYEKAFYHLQNIASTFDGAKVLGKENTQLILTSSAFRAQEIVEKVLSDNADDIAKSCVMMTLTIIGIALTVLTFIFTGGTAAIALAAVGTVLGLIWVVMDAQSLKESFDSEKIGTLDKVWMIFSFVCCLLIVLTAAVLCASPIGIITSLTTGLILLIIHIIYFIRVIKNQSE